MLNIVVEPEGVPGCVLIRAAGEWTGPGRLTRALGINLGHYGADLTAGDLQLRDGPRIIDSLVRITPRIGISKAADLPLRYVIQALGKL